MRRLPLLALTAVAAAAVFVACAPEEKRYVTNAGSGDVTPTMTTTDVSTLISDSGYTRYHLETPLWQMFEDAEEPFWRFPEGLELEQYDLSMNPKANVQCDSAVYFSRKRLWRLDGNVVMVNPQADSFLTQQLFWDQNSRKIYTDSFIHIVRTDRIIEGYGMESDQSMQYYTVLNPTAILPASSMPGRNKEKNDSAAAKPDTAAKASVRPSARPSAPKTQPTDASLRAVKATDATTDRQKPVKAEFKFSKNTDK